MDLMSVKKDIQMGSDRLFPYKPSPTEIFIESMVALQEYLQKLSDDEIELFFHKLIDENVITLSVAAEIMYNLATHFDNHEYYSAGVSLLLSASQFYFEDNIENIFYDKQLKLMLDSPENETRKIGEGLAKLIKKPILEESPIEKFFPIGSPEFNVELKKIVEQIQNNKTLAMPDHVYKV